MLQNKLYEFENALPAQTRVGKLIVVLVFLIMAGLWISPVQKLIQEGYHPEDARIYYVLVTFTFFFGLFTVLLTKNKKTGWFLLANFLAFLAGVMIGTFVTVPIDDVGQLFQWRRVLSAVIGLCMFTALVLLFHHSTIKRVSVNNFFFGFCMTCCILMILFGCWFMKFARG